MKKIEKVEVVSALKASEKNIIDAFIVGYGKLTSLVSAKLGKLTGDALKAEKKAFLASVRATYGLKGETESLPTWYKSLARITRRYGEIKTPPPEKTAETTENEVEKVSPAENQEKAYTESEPVDLFANVLSQLVKYQKLNRVEALKAFGLACNRVYKVA